jgi:membrane fusion protein, copper/silver efflux system
MTTPTLRAAGTVKYDEARLTDVNLKFDGWITDLFVNAVGQPVTHGQALFTVFSQELVDVQNEILLGLRNRDQLADSQASNATEFAERVVDVPRQKLLRWDVPSLFVRNLESNRRLQESVEFQAPTDGVIIEKNVVKGAYVERGRTLFKLADLSVVWVEADFHESDLPALRAGAKAILTADAWPGQRMEGRVEQILPYLSEPNRTAKVRLALSNRDGRLKPGMFVTVDVDAVGRDGLLVPADAIMDSGTRSIAFVAQGRGHFEPREVRIGARVNGKAIVLDGLQEGEEVADRAAFFLDSESQTRGALQDYQAAGSDAKDPTPTSFVLRLRTTPDPPHAGENAIEVQVRDGRGRAVTDAEIRVAFTMAAMPAMNMPAMRAQSALRHVGNGIYRGAATLSMAGTWDARVSAVRTGQTLVDQRSSLQVR